MPLVNRTRQTVVADKHQLGDAAAAADKQRADRILLFALTLLVLLAYLPVLIWPHWGLFDDAGLILQNCRSYWSLPEHDLSWINHIWRPGLFLYVMALWPLTPNNPFGYHLANFLFFTATVCLTYLLSLRLSRSRLCSFLAASWWLFTPGTFEVIYTLDKQEQYLPLLFLLFLYGYYRGRDCLAEKTGPLRMVMCWGLMVATCIAGFLSKETAQLLICTCLLYVIAVCGRCVFESRHQRSLKSWLDPYMIWSVINALTVVALVGLYQVVYGKVSASSGYIVLDLNIRHILLKALSYCRLFPDFALMLSVATLASGLGAVVRQTRDSGSGGRKQTAVWFASQSGSLLDSCCLISTALVGAFALLAFNAFNSALSYTWLPLYSFLLPATACGAAMLMQLPFKRYKRRAEQVLCAGFVVLLATQINNRCLEAQFQFQMDAMTHELAKRVAQLAGSQRSQMRILLPFTNIDASEIAERLEYFARDRAVPNYIESRQEGSDGSLPLLFFNFAQYTHSEEIKQRSQLGIHFRGRDIPYKRTAPPEFVGLEGYGIMAGSCPTSNWLSAPVCVGDWLLIPFGDLPRERVSLRGSELFNEPWQAKLGAFPTLLVSKEWQITRRLQTLTGKRAHIGWVLLNITGQVPVSIPLDADGWMENKSSILYHEREENNVLQLHLTRTPAPSIVISGTEDMESVRPSSSEAKAVEASDRGGIDNRKATHLAPPCRTESQELVVDLPLVNGAPVGQGIRKLDLYSVEPLVIPPDTRRLLMQITRMHLVAPPHSFVLAEPIRH